MYTLLIASLLALFFTYQESIGNCKNGLAWGVVLLTILAALHYDFGNDYMSYFNGYKEITNQGFDFDAILDKEVWKEPGWAFLCFAFYPLGGFFSLVIFLSILQNMIYYKFIQKYVDKKWLVLALFIYLFSTSYYVLNMSMLRQGLAISLFVWAFNFIKEKKILPAATLIISAASIHNSAMILFPFILWGEIPMNQTFSKIFSVVCGIIFFALYLNTEYVNLIFAGFMAMDNFQEYAITYEDTAYQATYGIGFIFKTIPFVMFLFYLLKNKEAERWQRQIVSIACIGTFIVPFAQNVPLITRIGLYFEVFTIFAIPIVYKWIPNIRIKIIVINILVMITLYDYYLFFDASVFAKYYSTYKTIFSAM